MNQIQKTLLKPNITDPFLASNFQKLIITLIAFQVIWAMGNLLSFNCQSDLNNELKEQACYFNDIMSPVT